MRIEHGAAQREHSVSASAARFAEGKPWVDADNYGRERLTVSR